jgi:hypothetical protein
VNTERRRIVIAAVLGFAALAVSALPSLAQDAKPDDKAIQDKAKQDDKDGEKKPTYGLIFGTAYGPDDRPIYGVRVKIYRVGKKHPSWELYSDHRGEFAQRVPPGPADFVVKGEVEVAPMKNGKQQKSLKKRLKGESKVHLDGTEERDFGLHLIE